MAEEAARIRIYPLSRAAFPGSESKFEVQVEGAKETTIDVRPCDEASGYEINVDKEGGSTRIVTIKSPIDAENACLDFFIEARDDAGMIIAREHAEIITGPKVMPPTFAVTTFIGVVMVVIGFTTDTALARYSLIVLGMGAVVSAMIISLIGIYGKQIGYPWHFTREK